MKDLLNYGNIPPAQAMTDKEGGVSCTLRALRYSHWVMNEKGEYIFDSPAKIRAGDGWYTQDIRFSAPETAFVVMDPWVDMSDDFLNRYFGAVEAEYTLPLVRAVSAAGFRVIVLTNKPPRPYNTRVSAEYYDLEKAGRAEILYHEDFTPESFSAYLTDCGIKNLVYTGYCSNMCVPFRPLGIARMALERKFGMFFVPECSAAMEHGDTWETREVHRATTLIIGQTQALLLRFEDIMNALK